MVKPIFTDAYLWNEAIPVQPLAEKYLYDEQMGLEICGDWCGGPRIEGAFLSGLALAEKINNKTFSE